MAKFEEMGGYVGGDGWRSWWRWVVKLVKTGGKVGGDRWLSWRRWVLCWRRWVAMLVEMGGKVGGDGWLSWWRWVDKLVGDALVAEGSTPACYDSSLGSNPNISQEYKMGDQGKGVANTH